MHDEFLTALRENPNDDVSRLVYADWLDEHEPPFPGPPDSGLGPALAELLRLEVRIASGGLPDDERVSLMNRMAELGRRAERGWLLAVNRVPFVRCSVRKRTGGSPLDGTLELANYATHALQVTHDASILQYLRLRITDPLGGSTEQPYYDYPLGWVMQFRLTPGERTSVRVNLLNTIPAGEVTVGAYTVEASYHYDRVTSRADAVRVELTDDDRKMWKLGRYARE